MKKTGFIYEVKTPKTKAVSKIFEFKTAKHLSKAAFRDKGTDKLQIRLCFLDNCCILEIHVANWQQEASHVNYTTFVFHVCRGSALTKSRSWHQAIDEFQSSSLTNELIHFSFELVGRTRKTGRDPQSPAPLVSNRRKSVIESYSHYAQVKKINKSTPSLLWQTFLLKTNKIQPDEIQWRQLNRVRIYYGDG